MKRGTILKAAAAVAAASVLPARDQAKPTLRFAAVFSNKDIRAGIKLRMPPGDAWQLLGRSIGANPTPMAYAEVYTGLQTGAIDGQDNPLPNVQNMKFYEVMSQIVLTSHLVGYDLLTMNLKAWNAMGAAKQKSFQSAADKAMAWSAAEHLKREAELADGFKKQGLEVYAPDVKAFRAHAQKVYLAADEAKEWPKGMLEKINALK